MLLGVVDQGGKFGLSACNLKGFFFNKKLQNWSLAYQGYSMQEAEF